MADPNKIKKLTEQLRKQAFPGQTLCQIEFSNGEQTNSFIPDDVLADNSVSNAEWWNRHNQETYLPLIRGEFKAIKATPIQEH